ncbi:MAG: NADH-quinone oxidoreductase subunit N [Acidimicrobiales bacterium]
MSLSFLATAAFATTANAASAQHLKLPSITYLAILPELLTLGGALVMLGSSALLRKRMEATTAASLTILTGSASLIAGVGQWINTTAHGAHVTIDSSVIQDGFSAFITILVSCAVIVTAFIGQGWLVREKSDGPEMHALMLVSAMGAMLMGEANDLILVFLGLEIMSIALYVLAAGNARREESGEAALKYFVLGSFSSAVFLYGMALVYGATGSTNLAQIADFLSKNILLHNGLLLAGIALLLVGFAFKIAAVPFHLWTPDVYQGSPSPVTGFMAAVAKTGGFAALLRVFVSSFPTVRADWQPIIWVLAVITLLFGAVVGVVQRDVKRMLAYSSINHAGFILLGLYLATQRGVSGSLYYLFTYSFMVMGSFGVVTVVAGLGDANHDLDSWRGLAFRQPWLAVPMIIFLLAQAGMPATTGLWAKIYVIEGATGTPGGIALSIIAMVSAVIAGFFYLRLVLYMVQNPNAAQGDIGDVVDVDVADEGPAGLGNRGSGGAVVVGSPVLAAADVGGATVLTTIRTQAAAALPIPLSIATGIFLCALVTVLFGVWPSPIINFAHGATLLFH